MIRENTELLFADKIGIVFGGLVAARDVTMRVPKGQVVSLIGPNGAGKTTVFNLLTGFYKTDSGDIRLEGQSLSGLKPSQYINKGIARTFQNLRLFRQMTVLENVLVGRQRLIRYSPLDVIFNTRKKKSLEKEAEEHCCVILEQVGLIDQRYKFPGSLSYGKQKYLEIARAMASSPKIILLDEPAAGLNPQETRDLSLFTRRLLDLGFTVLLIEHDMSLVMRISDYVYVMNQGMMLCEGTPEHVRSDAQVIEAYIGKGGRGLVAKSRKH